jgi:cytidylate kinase
VTPADERNARRIVVAIDGPAGAGKSTVALELAKRLGYTLVDTGALYRAVAIVARERGISWDDGPALGVLTRDLQLEFGRSADGAPRVCIDGRDRADDIRTPDISMGASDVSRHPEVRDALLGLQRRLGHEGGVVLEGRDIGTVVFPNAEAKIFLTASAEIRADRRVQDLRARGLDADPVKTLAEVQARDAQDSSRAVAPLKPAADSVVVDTTHMGFDEVVKRLVAIVHAASAAGGSG